MNRTTRTTGLVLGFAAAGAAAAATLLGFLRAASRNGTAEGEATPHDGSSASTNTADLSGRTVYITDRGVRYHTADCLHLRGTVRAVPIEDAWEDHTPCAICNPLK